MTPNTHIWKWLRCGQASGRLVVAWEFREELTKRSALPPSSIAKHYKALLKYYTSSLKYCNALQSITKVKHFLPQVLHHITKVSHSLPWSEEPRGVATCQNCPQREVSRSTCKSGTKAETSVLWPLGHYHYASTSIFW